MSQARHSFSSLCIGRGRPVSLQVFRYLLRPLVPVLMALMFSSAAHAQGTMDFSGAQTLMGTFKMSAAWTGSLESLTYSIDVPQYETVEEALEGIRIRGDRVRSAGG